MGKSKFFVILFLLYATLAIAQDGRYIIFFKDKSGTTFSVDDPIKFISQKSIDRRTRQHIAITEEDFPVNATYVTQLSDAGISALYTSRWMNCALAELQDSQISSVEGLAFVDRVEYVAPIKGSSSGGRTTRVKEIKDTHSELVNQTQLTMLGLDEMHGEDIDGTGVRVAIFDSGFEGVNTTAPFSALLSENRIQYMHDFVGQSDNVFQYDVHGTEVLSIMAAQQRDTYLGGAFNATYQLYVTEDVESEYRIEEYNWLVAAEKADSAGVDIINSSLGYNVFDDSSMDYTTSQMDGKTAVISKAAHLALDKGILVVVSAGNEGNTSWKLVDPPADVEGVLAVGSITSNGSLSNFSSVGPTSDNRIKPEVVALGSMVAIIKSNGTLGISSGTSVAAPLIASLAAGLLQAFPDLSANQLQKAIVASGDKANAPDNLKGYGLPHYLVAKGIIDPVNAVEPTPMSGLYLYPNPADSIVKIAIDLPENEVVSIEVFNLSGQRKLQVEHKTSRGKDPIELNVSSFASGLYFVKVKGKGIRHTFRLVKH